VRTASLLLALQRQSLMLAAFAALVVAGLVVSTGAWILLWKTRRSSSDDGDPEVSG
jgi:allantoicase